MEITKHNFEEFYKEFEQNLPKVHFTPNFFIPLKKKKKKVRNSIL